MGRFLRLYLVIVFLILRVTYVHCQGQVSISGIKGEFKFDGLLDDACWQNIEPLNMVMHTPTFPREGNDFNMVFNEGRSTYRDVEDPRLPLFNNRSVLLKYTYTFTL